MGWAVWGGWGEDIVGVGVGVGVGVMVVGGDIAAVELV